MHGDQRSNNVISSVVEHGIWLANSKGSAIAWTYMRTYHVPLEAIRRVLAYPETRRQRPAVCIR